MSTDIFSRNDSVVKSVHRDADDGELLGQQTVADQVVESGHQQALGKIAGGAENHQHARFSRCLIEDAGAARALKMTGLTHQESLTRSRVCGDTEFAWHQTN